MDIIFFLIVCVDVWKMSQVKNNINGIDVYYAVIQFLFLDHFVQQVFFIPAYYRICPPFDMHKFEDKKFILNNVFTFFAIN